jgi:hypothetical protein
VKQFVATDRLSSFVLRLSIDTQAIKGIRLKRVDVPFQRLMMMQPDMTCTRLSRWSFAIDQQQDAY